MCKILLTSVWLLFFSFIASAQFNKGNVLIGGQLSYQTYKNADQNTTNQNVSNGNFIVSVGKAFKENAAFGINLSYTPITQSNYYTIAGNVNYKNDLYSIGVYYRMYKDLGKSFYLFGEVAIGYNGSSTSGKDSTGNEILTGTGSGGTLSFMPGISYRITKKFFLEASIPNLFSVNYSHQKTSINGISNTQDQFGVAASLTSNPLSNIGIGFRLVL